MPDETEVQKFLFDAGLGEAAQRDMELRVSALEERMNHIIQRATVKDVPVIQSILNLSTDPDEIELLGKCLVRVAEILPELQELKKRHDVVATVREQPGWLAATFADFTSDVDEFIDTHQSYPIEDEE